MSENLKKKAIGGLKWSAIDNIASQGITFVIGIVLARLLSPAEFGTLGIAMIFVGLFNKFVDCGFSNALIRKKNVEPVDYNTAFFFNIIVSVVLYVICFFLSPYVSSFFNDEELVVVLKWMSLVIIINGVGIIQKTILIKRIDFKTQAKISLISSFLSGIIGIISAYMGKGVMSLVFQQLSRQTLNTLLLWFYNRWYPKLEFSINSFRQQFSFGIKLLFSGLIDYACNEAATFVIGKVHSPATLGQYSRARQFSSIFSSNLSTITERVTFPVLAQFQDNKEMLAMQYRKMVKCLMLICGLLMITLACTAESVVLILVGDKWVEAILYLQIICFNDLFYPIKLVNLNAIQVTGRSDLILKVTILKRLIQIVPIFLGVFNIYYMLYGLVLASFLGTLLNAYFASKCIPYTLKEQVRDFMRPLFICLVPGVAMSLVTYFDFNIYIQLLLQLLIGIVTFYAIIRVVKLPEWYYLKDILFSVVLKNKRNNYEKAS